MSNSISWRRFCRIDIDNRVPHPTTLMKITTRCGAQAVADLNETLLATGVEARVVKGKVRADTTVMSANVRYPTDSGLLATAVVKIGQLVRRIKATGAASRTTFRDRRRAAHRVREIASKLRLRGAAARDEAHTAVARITGELARLVDQATAEAAALVRNARRTLPRTAGHVRGRLNRAVNELDTLLERAAQVTAHARTRLGGGKPDSATRLVSLHEPRRPTDP